MITEELKKL